MTSIRISTLIALLFLVSGNVSPKAQIGKINGLVVMSNWFGECFNGDTMAISAELVPGSGKLHFVGQPGSMMRESATIAFKYAKAHAQEYGADKKTIKNNDMYVYLPDPDFACDGPSAGTAMLCVMISVYSGRPIDDTLALTGEIDADGNVLPIGGLPEKMHGADKNGIDFILAPEGNCDDWAWAGDIITRVDVDFVGKVGEVLNRVLF